MAPMQRLIPVALVLAVVSFGCEEEKKPAAATATAAAAPPPTPSPTPAPEPTPAASATPAPSSSADIERGKLATKKNELKAKVESGKASAADKKELKELCKQLGDIS